MISLIFRCILDCVVSSQFVGDGVIEGEVSIVERIVDVVDVVVEIVESGISVVGVVADIMLGLAMESLLGELITD